MTELATNENRRRVMIVDDDEVSAGLLTTSLSDEFAVLTLASGEACLRQYAAYRPAVVLLDIEMSGIDGYETCERLRGLDAEAGVAERPAVIFVSGHDTLEDRLRAYEAGGDDFIVKPPEPAEVLRKVKVMVDLVAERGRLRAETDSAREMAMGFLTNLGESGTALQFLRRAPECAGYAELARLAIASLREYGLDTHVQMRPPGERLTFTESGPASPLEESVFAKVVDLGRLFQFRRRLVVNYLHVSLLVNDLPLEDEDRCGRLRDHLAIIAEGCEASLRALIRTAEVETRTRQLRQSAIAMRQALASLRDQYQAQQTETGVILHQLKERFAKELIFMGLTEAQEEQLETLLGAAIDESLQLFQQGLDFEVRLAELLEITTTEA